MIGTLFSLAIVVYLYFVSDETVTNFPFLGGVLVSIAAFLLVLYILIITLSWNPLQKAEKKLTPRLLEIFRHDHFLLYSHWVVFLFFLLSLGFAFDLTVFQLFPETLVLMIWVVLLGITLDCLYHLTKRIMGYFNPLHVVGVFNQRAQHCVRAADERDLCDWIDTLSEIATKAISRNSMSLALLVIDKLQMIARNYLHMARGITYHEGEKNIPKAAGGMGEHVSYTVFYLFQRLELIFNHALGQHLEPVCNAILTTLGKMIIYGAKFDVSMASYPLYYIGKLAKKAQLDQQLPEVANHATLTMLESSKALIKDVDLQYMEIKEPFFSMITYMHEIAKETFRQDKSISIQLLTQPFHDLKAFFADEKIASHQDTPAIKQRIDVVLEEFTTLESILQTLPLPDLAKEQETPPVKEAAPPKEEETPPPAD